MSIIKRPKKTPKMIPPEDGIYLDGEWLGIPKDVYFNEDGEPAPIPDGVYKDGVRIGDVPDE